MNNFWSESLEEFKVRGKNYFKDKIKITSEVPYFVLEDCFFENYSDAKAYSNNVDSENFFLFFVFIIPKTDTIKKDSLVLKFKKKENIELPERIKKFLFETDNDFRNKNLKIIPKVKDGPKFLKKITKPILIGMKTKITYHQGPNKIVINMDTTSGFFSSQATHNALKYIKQIKIDLGFVVQTEKEKERLLGTFSFDGEEIKDK